MTQPHPASPRLSAPPSSSSSSSSAPASPHPFPLPAIHSFPPFYTLQPNPTSRAQQLAQWRSLLLSFCRHHRLFSIDLVPSPLSLAPSVAAPGVRAHDLRRDVWASLFTNPRIGRRLDAETVRTVVAEMVRCGEAAWDRGDSGRPAAVSATRVWVYWRTPAQWGDLIYDWIVATGQNRSIVTLFELSEGDLVDGKEFANLPIPLLKQALQHLASQGKAQIFAGTDAEDGEGVKFV